jgi:hypothetical protein
MRWSFWQVSGGRRFAALVTCLVFAFVGGAAPAAAAPPAIINGTLAIPFTDPGPFPDDCRPGITGSAEGTDTITFHNVRGDNAWHVNYVIESTSTVTWSDGSYTLIDGRSHGTWLRSVAPGWFTFREHEVGDTYSASGAFLFRTTFKYVERAYLDDSGVVTKFEKVFTNAFGGCPALS